MIVLAESVLVAWPRRVVLVVVAAREMMCAGGVTTMAQRRRRVPDSVAAEVSANAASRVCAFSYSICDYYSCSFCCTAAAADRKCIRLRITARILETGPLCLRLGAILDQLKERRRQQHARIFL